MPVGPLRFQTINQQVVDREAQIQGAPAYSKLRRALLQASAIAANEDNPAKKREMLRAAMEGTGTGISDVSLSAHNAALNKVGRDTDIANQGLLVEYQTESAKEAQERGISAQKEMQGLSLAEARAAQERGISASQALQEKQILAAGIAQERGITASQAMQELSLAANKTAQQTSITAAEKAQGLSLAEAREQARLNREFELSVRNEDYGKSLGLAGFNAEIAKANLAYPITVKTPYLTPQGAPADPIERANLQWQQSYDRAMRNFYANR